MQNDEHNDCPDADMARTGHKRATPAAPDGVEKDERLDADKAGLARGEQDRSAAQEDDPELEPTEEFVDAQITPGAKTVARSIAYAYSGPLPPAAEMMAYDEETRRHILEMHRLQIEHSIRQDERITDEVIEADRQQSRREDQLVQADIEQSQKAQDKTFIIYVALIITLVVAVVLGQTSAAIAIATLLGGVSITNMYVSHRSRERSASGELQKPKDESSGEADDKE